MTSPQAYARNRNKAIAHQSRVRTYTAPTRLTPSTDYQSLARGYDEVSHGPDHGGDGVERRVRPGTDGLGNHAIHRNHIAARHRTERAGRAHRHSVGCNPA